MKETSKGHVPHSLENLRILDLKRRILTHYTCNAPSQKILDKYKIRAIGDRYGCVDSREVLEIPLEVYRKAGWPVVNDESILKINLEKLMRDLSS